MNDLGPNFGLKTKKLSNFYRKSKFGWLDFWFLPLLYKNFYSKIWWVHCFCLSRLDNSLQWPIRASKTSGLPKCKKKLAKKGVKCTTFKGYWGTSSGLQNNFMLLWAKNPRNRSRCMCSYKMKKSGFFDNLSALQISLLWPSPHCPHGFSQKNWRYEAKFTT